MTSRERPDLPSRDEIGNLSRAEGRELAEELRDEVRRHDHLYYVENEPEISDEACDRLYGTLEAVEDAFPHLVTPDSPTQTVGAEPLDSFPTVEHVARHLLEPELDGASVEVVYEDGVVIRAATPEPRRPQAWERA